VEGKDRIAKAARADAGSRRGVLGHCRASSNSKGILVGIVPICLARAWREVALLTTQYYL